MRRIIDIWFKKHTELVPNEYSIKWYNTYTWTGLTIRFYKYEFRIGIAYDR